MPSSLFVEGNLEDHTEIGSDVVDGGDLCDGGPVSLLTSSTKRSKATSTGCPEMLEKLKAFRKS